jgi:hypothetical protein
MMRCRVIARCDMFQMTGMSRTSPSPALRVGGIGARRDRCGDVTRIPRDNHLYTT